MDRRGLQTGRRQDRLDAVGRRLAQGHHQDAPPHDARHPRQRQKVEQQPVERHGRTGRRLQPHELRKFLIRAFGQLEQPDDRLFARQRDQDMGRADPGTVQLRAELLARRLRMFRRARVGLPFKADAFADVQTLGGDLRIEAQQLLIIPVECEILRHVSPSNGPDSRPAYRLPYDDRQSAWYPTVSEAARR